MAVRVTVDYHGNFFTRNPVSQFHRNQYDVLDDAGRVGQEMARGQLMPGHGFLSGDLRDSVQPRRLRAYRGAAFVGRARVVTGARGWESVRRYANRVEQRYRFMARATVLLRAWVGSNTASIARKLVRDLA